MKEKLKRILWGNSNWEYWDESIESEGLIPSLALFTIIMGFVTIILFVIKIIKYFA